MNDQLTYGTWLRRRRRELDLTQAELAVRVGCALTTIEKLEGDARRPSKVLAERLADVLLLTPDARAGFLSGARGGWMGEETGSSALSAPVEPAEPGSALPVPLTPLIGRAREVAAVCAALEQTSVRVLTLTGPGGVGKTRLALQVVAEMEPAFVDGVVFVDLAPIRDPALVATTIADVLGIPDVAGHTRLARLQTTLRQQQMLLLLDNFEQVVAAAPVVGELLTAAPRLKVLVTSRAVVGVYGEHDFPVPPLPLPEQNDLPHLDRLMQVETVRLFVERAQAARPDFRLTGENARAVSAICHQLEGLPLSIELAAARVRLLSPQVLLQRFGMGMPGRLKVLTGGPRSVPQRQQTVRATIAWSYDLLDAREQQLFRRLGVFVGGCTLEAAEVVCGWEDSEQVQASLEVLLDTSLVQQHEPPDGEPRFTMLETIREYALEQLEARGEAAELRGRHAHYFLALAEASESNLQASAQASWLVRLETEYDNLRAALHTAEDGQPERGLRLAAALWRFWHIQGYWSDAGRWLNLFLNHGDSVRPELRARVLGLAGRLALDQGDLVRSKALLEEYVAVLRQQDDRQRLAWALNDLSWVALHGGDYARARSLLEEKLQLCRDLHDQDGVAYTLEHLGVIALEQRDDEQALSLLAESSKLMRELADRRGLAWCLEKLGLVAFYRREDALAQRLFAEALSSFRALGDQAGIACLLLRTARSALQQGQLAEADGLVRESLQRLMQLGDKRNIAACLETAAVLAVACDQDLRAVRLWGAADTLRAAAGLPVPPAEWAHDRCYRAAVRERLDAGTHAIAWAEGQAMTLEQAIDYALEETTPAEP